MKNRDLAYNAGAAHPSLLARTFSAVAVTVLCFRKGNGVYYEKQWICRWNGGLLKRILRIAANGIAQSIWPLAALVCVTMGPVFITVVGQCMGGVFMLFGGFYAGDEMHRLGVCVEGIEELEEMSGTILVGKVEENETADERMAGAVENNTENTIETREYRDVVYDTLSEAQKFDLYLPETGEGPFPLIMFIHGGGWFAGDKTDGQERAWVTLREKGYAVASINYRLSGETPHPAGIIDCKTALRCLKAHADEYHIDAERIAVSGDSSGGHYALMAALTPGNPDFEDLARGNPEQSSDVACAVAWYPATDLAETMRTVREGEYTGFGADFAWSNIERYAGKKIEDVNDDVLVSASPIQYVTEDMPPVLLQHGNADTICPIGQSQRIYQKMVETAGEDRVEFDVLDGAEHGDADFETAENLERIVQFLKQCGL